MLLVVVLVVLEVVLVVLVAASQLRKPLLWRLWVVFQQQIALKVSLCSKMVVFTV